MLGWIALFLTITSTNGQTADLLTTTSAATQVTSIPVYNATISGTPSDTSVVVFPDESSCDYSTGGLYCFPLDNSFVSMTGWTRFFYNKAYGLINNSGLVDVTMHFAADDQMAASWIGVPNTGNVAINVNISWFTSTLAPQATSSIADPYYFYVAPNSAVYNAFPTGSSRGPTFYAVQTPTRQLLQSVNSNASPTSAGSTSSSTNGSTNTDSGSDSNAADTASNSALSRGAIAGIVIGAVALFFVLLLLAILICLLVRRNRHAEKAAELAIEKHEDRLRAGALIPGNLYTQQELAGAGNLRTRPGDSILNPTPSVDLASSDTSLPQGGRQAVPGRTRWPLNASNERVGAGS